MKKSSVLAFSLGLGTGILCYKYRDYISDLTYAFGSAVQDVLRPVLDAMVSGECSCSCCSKLAKEAQTILPGEVPAPFVEDEEIIEAKPESEEAKDSGAEE